MMYINGVKVLGDKFVWDKCHKIYIIEDNNDLIDCMESWGQLINGEDLFDIRDLENIWYKSCPLKFISNWKLDKQYVSQEESFNNIDFRFEVE